MSPRAALRTPDDLLAARLIPAAQREDAARVADRYAVAVTPAMARLIDPSDAADPLGRQFLPDARELETAPAERADPIGDGAHSPLPGVVHRYPDRALFAPTLVCPVYCRFCFRRARVGPGAGAALTKSQIAAALAYFAAHPEIREVIFTGGDPLGLTAARLGALVASVAAIPHVETIRLHSRVPVVAPERIDAAMLDALAGGGRTIVVAAHANHPREFAGEARAALRRLSRAGVMLLGQSVLLKGVNDDPATLEALMRAFLAAGVKPYYLHHPDLAPGTAHFRLPVARGLEIVAALRGRISGLAQPAYMLDIPGGFGKVALDGPKARARADGAWELTDFRGATHLYRDG